MAARKRRARPIRGQEREKTVSSVAATLHAPVLETPEVGPRAGVRPRVTDGDGGNAGNRKDEGKWKDGRGEGLQGMVTLREEGPRGILHTGSGGHDSS